MHSEEIILENNQITELVDEKDCTEGAGHFHFYKQIRFQNKINESVNYCKIELKHKSLNPGIVFLGFKGSIFSIDQKQERIEKEKIENGEVTTIRDVYSTNEYSSKLRSKKNLLEKNQEAIENSKRQEDIEYNKSIEESQRIQVTSELDEEIGLELNSRIKFEKGEGSSTQEPSPDNNQLVNFDQPNSVPMATFGVSKPAPNSPVNKDESEPMVWANDH